MSSTPRRLLVVEHDHRVGSYIAQALRAEGYQVDWATSDDEALACVRRAPPELVVLDATRPDRGGTELARAFREEWSDVPILVVTTGLGNEDLFSEIAQARLVKPFRLDDLLTRVELMLAR